MMSRFAARFERLKALSPETIRFALSAGCRIQLDRLRYWLRGGPGRDDEVAALAGKAGGSLKTYLETRAARRFYPSVSPQHRDATLNVLKRTMAARAYRAIEEAERLCEHRFDLPGCRDLALGQRIDWHRDPVSGHRQHQRFWADDIAGVDVASDAARIVELNRHQHLPRLAKAYLLTKDERFAIEVIAQLESWIEQNAVWQGANWQSTLEISTRTISWLWAIFMILPSAAFDERACRRICQSLFEQIEHVYRYASADAAPIAQRIGEATALFIAGIIFSDASRASSWLRKGQSVLSDAASAMPGQHGTPGLSVSCYCGASDFFLQAVVLARLHRMVFSEFCLTTLSQMLDFVLHATRPEATVPGFGEYGGEYGGEHGSRRALALALDHHQNYADSLCTGAVLFGRPDFKFAAGDFAEQTLWLLGPDAVHVFESLESRTPNRLRHSWANGGYLIERSDWSAEANYLVFGGGLGGNGRGQPDLSIFLSAGRTPLLVDAGTSALDWQSRSPARVTKQLAVGGLDYVDAEQNGCLRQRQPATHRRRLLYVRPNYWIVLDDLLGSGEHTFNFLYRFTPETSLFIVEEEPKGNVECRARVDQMAVELAMHSTWPVNAEAVSTELGLIPQWKAVRGGKQQPAAVFKGTARGFAPMAVMTFLKPGNGPALQARRLNIRGGRALASVVHDGCFEDICVAAPDTSTLLQVMDFRLTGELFWMRMENGVLRQLFAVNASKIQWAGQDILAEHQPVPHVMVHLWDNGLIIERGDQEEQVYVRDFGDRQCRRR
jgi:hypothetical protein